MIILFTPVDILFCNDDLVLYVDYNLEKNERLSGYNFLINKVLVKRLISLLKDVSPRSSRSTSLSTCPFYLLCVYLSDYSFIGVRLIFSYQFISNSSVHAKNLRRKI